MKKYFERYNTAFDRIANVIFFLIGLAIFIYAQTLSSSSFGTSIGPSATPTLWSCVLMICSGIGIVVSFKDKRPPKKKEKPLAYDVFLPFLVSLIVYIFVLEPLGYVISTFLFLVVTFQIMRRGEIGKSILIAACFSIGVYLLYVYVAGGSLPKMPILGI